MLLNCGVGKDSWESLGLKGDPTSSSKGNQSWIFTGRMMLKLKLQYFGHLMQRTDSLEKALMLGKKKAGGGEDDRRWDGWMASLTRWTRVWGRSGRWWRTGRPGVLQSLGSQRVGYDWATEQNRVKWSRATSTSNSNKTVELEERKGAKPDEDKERAKCKAWIKSNLHQPTPVLCRMAELYCSHDAL